MELNSNESVFAFAAWLTTRENAVTLGGSHDAAIAAELADEFGKSQNSPPVRDDFSDRIKPYPDM